MSWRDLDPYRGVFHWALAKTPSRVNRFALGGVGFGFLLYVITSPTFGLPADPSWSQRAWNGVVTFGSAIAVALLLGYVISVVVAPTEQRNALRGLAQPRDQQELLRIRVSVAVEALKGRSVVVKGAEYTDPVFVLVNVANDDRGGDFEARVREIVGWVDDPPSVLNVPWEDSSEVQHISNGAERRVKLLGVSAARRAFWFWLPKPVDEGSAKKHFAVVIEDVDEPVSFVLELHDRTNEKTRRYRGAVTLDWPNDPTLQLTELRLVSP